MNPRQALGAQGVELPISPSKGTGGTASPRQVRAAGHWGTWTPQILACLEVGNLKESRGSPGWRTQVSWEEGPWNPWNCRWMCSATIRNYSRCKCVNFHRRVKETRDFPIIRHKMREISKCKMCFQCSPNASS